MCVSSLKARVLLQLRCLLLLACGRPSWSGREVLTRRELTSSHQPSLSGKTSMGHSILCLSAAQHVYVRLMCLYDMFICVVCDEHMYGGICVSV